MKQLFKIILFLTGTLAIGSSNDVLAKDNKILAENKVGKLMNTKYTPQWAHGAITNIFPNIFFVMGTNKIHHEGIDIQTSRNMIIVKNGKEITLINTVRLNEEQLKVLESMGTVTNIVKIGPFHGRDDAFYIDRYNAKLWALKGMQHSPGVKTDIDLIPNGKMPFPNSALFIFETTEQPEGIIHIALEGGILITCDSIKNWAYIDPYFSEQTGKDFTKQGLIQSANIDSVWIHAMHPKPQDFHRLLTSFKFKHLLSAHGEPLLNSAHEKISANIAEVNKTKDT